MLGAGALASTAPGCEYSRWVKEEQWLPAPLANLVGFSRVKSRLQSMSKSPVNMLEICSQILTSF